MYCINKIHKLFIVIIKPENIFYDGKQVYLFDFDIARNYIENQKRDTTVLGSQGYAAPEQFGFYQTDIRSDIYFFRSFISCFTY